VSNTTITLWVLIPYRRGVLDTAKFVSDLRQVKGFFGGILVSFTSKTDCHDIIEILLKVALHTITLTPLLYCVHFFHMQFIVTLLLSSNLSYINIRCQIENQVSDYRLLGASSLTCSLLSLFYYLQTFLIIS
jgi:hypothetical protein